KERTMSSDFTPESILAEARREQEEAEKQRHQEKEAEERCRRLRAAFQAVHDCTMQALAERIGREPTMDEFYRWWADRITDLGQVLVEMELASRVDGLPSGPIEKKYARRMLKLGMEKRTDEIVDMFRKTEGLDSFRNRLAGWLRYDLEKEIMGYPKSAR